MADLFSAYNYLVPAAGTVHGYPVSMVFSATPFEVDFRFVELDGDVFTPSGVFVDNSAGTGDLTIRVKNSGGYSVICPAGARLQAQYPAPANQQVEITGLGQATVVFVDFPVIPFQQEGASSLGNVEIADGDDVAQGTTTDPIATTPFSTPYTIVSLMKALATYAQTQENSTGLNGDPVATSPFGNPWGIISLLKTAAQELSLQTPDLDALRVSNDALLVKAIAPAASTFASVALTGASQVILALNANRKGCVIFNDSVNTLKLLCNASAASATNFTALLNPNDSLTLQPGEYTGEIRGFASAASGNARVTEFS